MKLGNRLALAASAVKGGTVIDIGSDHGYLPVYLLKNGICTFAAAADIREKPLASARSNAEKYGVSDRMRFYLTDGFDGIAEYYDTACICGMGGLTAADIIRRGKGGFGRLVLQPMTDAHILRGFLRENGYIIESEGYTVESGKPYAVITAVPAENAVQTPEQPVTYADMFLGTVRAACDASYAEYVKKIRASAVRRYGGTRDPRDAELIAECDALLGRREKFAE